jgi:membrane-bound lytic murein transglycosylase F
MNDMRRTRPSLLHFPLLARQPRVRRQAWSLSACLLLALLASACTPVEDGLPDRTGPAEAPVITHPLVERDLDEIRAGGILRMVTTYNSSSYFIHKGGHAGFEYELMARFAREQRMNLEVVVPDADENLVNILNSGRGDVLATGAPCTGDITEYVVETHPYNFVRKVLVLPADDLRPDDPSSLNGLRIHLPLHSPDRALLQDLKQRFNLRFFLVTAGPMVAADELIARVARGEIPATVADENLAMAALSYLPSARIGPTLSEPLPLTWQVRQNSPELLAALNAYLNQHFRMTEDGPLRNRVYGILYERYYNNDWSRQDQPISKGRPDISGRISPWDELIQAAADSNHLDWRLVTALIYEESRFDPEAISSAGASGLMQVMPNLAGDETDLLLDPQVNIRIGTQMLKEIYDGYAYLDSLDRWAFTLATYHAGFGHMSDARQLAMDSGLNPNRWRGAVRRVMPRLMQQRYFSQTRHGFYRGSDTVAYVQAILNRYRMYRRLVPQEVHPGEFLPVLDAAIPTPR